MAALRRAFLTALPKFLVSRTTGLLARVPLPRRLRPLLYGWFARRYGADLTEMAGQPSDYRNFATFFRRPLVAGSRPIADGAELVWPCDGRIITSGAVLDGAIPQVKGRDYRVEQLLQDAALARELDGGCQATIYLAPGDYHRVHTPFAGELLDSRHIRGALFPVNGKSVDCVRDLFPRNERVVFRCRLPSGLPAAIVMVSALNVGDTLVTHPLGAMRPGDELGQFGFGSTTIVLLPAGAARIPDLPRETVVRMGAAVPADS